MQREARTALEAACEGCPQGSQPQRAAAAARGWRAVLPSRRWCTHIGTPCVDAPCFLPLLRPSVNCLFPSVPQVAALMDPGSYSLCANTRMAVGRCGSGQGMHGRPRRPNICRAFKVGWICFSLHSSMFVSSLCCWL